MSGVYWWVTSTKEADKFLVKQKCVEYVQPYEAHVLCVKKSVSLPFFSNSKHR